mmetsp:Transcript_13208/g.38063  ORF Transcript_13208/g.38063 Transcript_13208/m.38063 type:complete len:213 (-) Transcript_13208:118-756(-)
MARQLRHVHMSTCPHNYTRRPSNVCRRFAVSRWRRGRSEQTTATYAPLRRAPRPPSANAGPVKLAPRPRSCGADVEPVMARPATCGEVGALRKEPATDGVKERRCGGVAVRQLAASSKPRPMSIRTEALAVDGALSPVHQVRCSVPWVAGCCTDHCGGHRYSSAWDFLRCASWETSPVVLSSFVNQSVTVWFMLTFTWSWRPMKRLPRCWGL